MSVYPLGTGTPTGPGPVPEDSALAPLHRATPPAVALAGAGVLFALFPVLRPFAAGAAGLAAADGWSSPAWLVAHLCAMAGYLAAGFGLLGHRDALAGFRGGRPAAVALLLWWTGSGLVLAGLGAAAFGLGTLGSWIERTRQFDLVALGSAITNGQPRLGLTLAGLGLLAVAGVLIAVAVLRSGVMPPGAGVLFALAFLAAPLQLIAPVWVQILHGVVTMLGCLVLAVQLRRLSTVTDVAESSPMGPVGR